MDATQKSSPYTQNYSGTISHWNDHRYTQHDVYTLNNLTYVSTTTILYKQCYQYSGKKNEKKK